MTKDEALKMALEALEDVQDMMTTSDWFNERVQAVRQALEQPDTGMTLRDHFAAKAMQGFATSDDEWGSADHMAKGAYEWADAMLKARGE